MSYQTVTDIITGTQNNLSNQINDLMKDNSSSPTTSFGDLVSYYKNDSKTEDVKSTEQPKEDFDKKIDDKPVESKDNSKDVKNEEVNKTSENLKAESSEEKEKSKESIKTSGDDEKKDKEIKIESRHLISTDDKVQNKELKDNTTAEEEDGEEEDLQEDDNAQLTLFEKEL